MLRRVDVQERRQGRPEVQGGTESSDEVRLEKKFAGGTVSEDEMRMEILNYG